MEKISRLGVVFLAIVGFFGSVVTIWQFFDRDTADLTAAIKLSESEIPADAVIGLAGDQEYALDKFVDDLKVKYCERVEVSYDGSKSRNVYYNGDICQSGKDAIEKIKTANKAQKEAPVRRLYKIALKNSGNRTATNIKLINQDISGVSVYDSTGEKIKTGEVTPGLQYKLPDLNPNEMLNVRVVTAKALPNSTFETENYPEISYSEGRAKYDVYRPVSGIVSDITAVFDGMPWILSLVILLIGSFIVTFVTLAIVVALQAVVEGKPLNKAFSIEPKDVKEA